MAGLETLEPVLTTRAERSQLRLKQMQYRTVPPQSAHWWQMHARQVQQYTLNFSLCSSQLSTTQHKLVECSLEHIPSMETPRRAQQSTPHLKTIRSYTENHYVMLPILFEEISIQQVQTNCARGDTICICPLQVDNIFTFIRQVAVLFQHNNIFIFGTCSGILAI